LLQTRARTRLERSSIWTANLIVLQKIANSAGFIEANQLKWFEFLVGAVGFEPTTR
jgi:hypothetical protein